MRMQRRVLDILQLTEGDTLVTIVDTFHNILMDCYTAESIIAYAMTDDEVYNFIKRCVFRFSVGEHNDLILHTSNAE